MKAIASKTVIALTGNDAVAEAMRQVNPDVVAAYPITPQTELMHKFADYVADGDVKTQFVLVECYRQKGDAARHKETAHYLKWRDTVAGMMAEPRSAIKYENVFPGETGFEFSQ